jgi:hypothetical protein
MSLESLIRSCLYNWLGYGNPNGSIWFIGTEEGGAEIWRNQTQTLASSLHLRSKFNLAMDFQHVWEDLYGVPLESFKGASVWNYMAAFLLNMEGENPSKEAIRDYVFGSKKLGSLISDHFMCELLPLPKRTKDSIKDYQDVWRDIKRYHNEVIPNRFDLIRKTISNNQGVKLIVSYERLLTEQWLRFFSKDVVKLDFWQYKKEEYTLYMIDLSEQRSVLLLSTPFFGNGRIGYEGLAVSASKVKEHREIG